mmetsp:Transcript_17465/g.34858  ORF Transcript_17465/g.34858 Transcript_17465/m.34858 type:complete len:110 (-) Transcript_17465:362-691(-)
MRQQNLLLMKSLKSRLQNRKVPPCQEVEMMLNIILFTSYNPALEQVLGEDAQSSTSYKGLLAFRLRSALKFIFRNVSLMLFATSQEGKKQHAEDATPLNTPALFPPNAL